MALYKLLVKNLPNAAYDQGDVVGIYDDSRDLGPWCEFTKHRAAKALPADTNVLMAPEWGRTFVVIHVSDDCELSDLQYLLEPQIIDNSDPDDPVFGKRRRFHLASPSSGTPLYNDLLGDGEATVTLAELQAVVVDKGGL